MCGVFNGSNISFNTAVLNLGYAYPLGYLIRSKGVRQIKKNQSKQVYLVRIFDLGVREGGTILIWGYAEGYNPDLGVREYQKVENPSCFNRSFILFLFLFTFSLFTLLTMNQSGPAWSKMEKRRSNAIVHYTAQV